MSPKTNDGGFELIEPDSEQIIPPKLWLKIATLIEQGQQEKVEKLIDDLLEKNKKEAE